MIWILLGVALAVAIYVYLIKPHSYWKSRGIKQRNVPPIFGDSFGPTTKKESLADMTRSLYNLSSTDKYVGAYQFLTPVVLVKDLELIKQITVKDFDNFHSHIFNAPEDADPLWGKNLLVIAGPKWRELRTTLTPAYTSSKMRTMFVLITECAKNFVEHLKKKSDEELSMIEFKSIFMKLANDMIASVAFGLKNNSLDDEDNEFFKMGNDVADFSTGFRTFKLMLFFFLPHIMSFFKIKMFSKEAAGFFRSLISRTIQYREKNNMTRPDMLQLLMDARKHGIKYEEEKGLDAGFAVAQESDIGKNSKTGKLDLTNEDITAQALIFFFAGFDTVSAAMSFTVYELALNPDVQRRLIEEIDEASAACGGDITYTALLEMKYLDMVVSESLRKWPPGILTDRRVTNKPYTLPPVRPGAESLTLNVGDPVWIPTIAIHRDPNYYPDPEKFDPERFSEENKKKIAPYSYMPFGSGPRICIGSRLALLEIKAVMFYLLSNFEICTNNKTEIPLTIDTTGVSMNAANGYWLSLRRRNKNA